MPQAIPAGLTGEHIIQALGDIDGGIEHPFGEPTGYTLVHEDKWYAPKAVIGLASRYTIGRILQPKEFSGGEANSFFGPPGTVGVLRGGKFGDFHFLTWRRY